MNVFLQWVKLFCAVSKLSEYLYKQIIKSTNKQVSPVKNGLTGLLPL
jgi:hypothetical protein